MDATTKGAFYILEVVTYDREWILWPDAFASVEGAEKFVKARILGRYQGSTLLPPGIFAIVHKYDDEITPVKSL